MSAKNLQLEIAFLQSALAAAELKCKLAQLEWQQANASVRYLRA